MANPLTTTEHKNAALNLSPDEKRLFAQVFQAADKEGFGVVTGDVALSFFPQKTRLPVDVLGEIWQIADTEDKGFLTPNGFYVVLRLIGYAQAGRAINAESATKSGPLPRFEGINSLGHSAPQPATPLQPQGSGGPIRVPSLLPEKASQYAALFEESGAQDGLLPGSTAKQIFDRAQLPNDILVRIWNLADTEMRGMLSSTEFIIAMHLLASFRSGTMRALPQSLPAGLYEAAARRGVQARPSSGIRSGPSSPPAPLPRQPTEGVARTISPLASQQPYSEPSVPSQAMNQTNIPAGDGWIITFAEKGKYDNQFAKLDTSGKGYVSGDEAVGFFSKSGLSEQDLAQIWDLSDINSEGRLSRDEFAVAMYLIVQSVQTRAPIPKALPPSLVPPGMRNIVSENHKSTAPDFQQPQPAAAPKQAQSAAEDLFGLDAISGPSQQAPAAVQVAQSTGDSSGFATPSSPKVPGSPSPLAKAPNQSTIFKPFQPSSSFGQSMVTPQQTGTSAVPQSRSIPVTDDDLLGDNDDASKAIGNDSVEIGNLSNQVTTLSNQMTEAKNKHSAADKIFSQSTSQKRDIESRLLQLRQAYEQETRDVRSLEERLEGIRAENTKLQQDLAMVQHSKDNLVEQHQHVAQQLAADQEENNRLREQISQTNIEIGKLKPQMEKAKSDARQQKGLVAINKKQLATAEAERDKIKAEIDTAIKDQGEASQELTEIQGKIESASQKHGNISRELGANPGASDTSSDEKKESLAYSGAHFAADTSSTASKVASPAPSANSMNPFFKRSNTNASIEQGTVASQTPGTGKSPNHSAFDDFFGPPARAENVTNPPPPASFGSPPMTSNRAKSPSSGAHGAESIASPTSETRPRIPPSPPRSRQISSTALPLKRVPSDNSAIGIPGPASRYEDTVGLGASTEQSDQLKLNQTNFEGSGASNDKFQDTVGQSNDLPGAFPDETPLQSPVHTGSSNAVGPGLVPQGTGTDPFSSKAMTPTSARDEFDSAFAGFGANSSEQHGDIVATTVTATQNEFPPIQHFENDDSESDSDGRFDDSFVPTALKANTERELNSSERTPSAPPPANAQSSPPSYRATLDTERQTIDDAPSKPAQFPAEFSGLLPSRENPVSISPSPTSVTLGETTVASPSLDEEPKSSGALSTGISKETFDAFDDDFEDLSEAQVADDTRDTEDLAAPIASRRDTLDEFNPTFDSPASSTRVNTTGFSEPHVASGRDTFTEASSSLQQSTSAFEAGSSFGGPSKTPSSHDWDSIFTGLDSIGSKEQSNGTAAVDEAFAGPSDVARATTEKPSLARAISQGTEHDDPILKNLTSMGFTREESLGALEKYDYNINKAADYLTSKS